MLISPLELLPPSSSAPSSTTSSSTSGTASFSPQITSDAITHYNNYKNSFSQYSQKYLPSAVLLGNVITSETASHDWTKNDFESLLIAIAQNNNWGTDSSGSWLMGYNTFNGAYQSADIQISAVSVIFNSAIENLNTNISYNDCLGNVLGSTDQVGSGLEQGSIDQIKCILSVYKTGRTDSSGFLNIGANTAGINYANSVVASWNSWESYLNSQQS